MTDTTDDLVKTSLAVSGLDEDSSLEAIDRAMGLVKAAKDTIKQLDDDLERRCLAWIAEHGDIVFGDVRYYAGEKKTTKQKPPNRVAYNIVLECVEGDLDRMVDLMVSSPFRHGEDVKAALGDRYGELFETIVKPELKDGKPVKQLQKFDKRFMKTAKKAPTPARKD